MEQVIQCLSAFLGCLGFAFVFRVHRHLPYALLASLGGAARNRFAFRTHRIMNSSVVWQASDSHYFNENVTKNRICDFCSV